MSNSTLFTRSLFSLPGKAVILLSLCIISLASGSLPTLARAATTWYVRAEALSGGDGTSWGTAFNNIQEAINSAASGDEIWVKEGRYELSSQLDLTLKGVKIYGGFQGLLLETREDRDPENYPTIVDGLSQTRGAIIDGQAPQGAILDGLIFTNCTTSGNGGALYIGPLATHPYIVNCRFIANSASKGGGAYIGNTFGASFYNCLFEHNSADSGGGVYIDNCVPILVNCIFDRNSATNGGGVYNDQPASTPAFSNCTFYKNHATGNGGGMYNTLLPDSTPPVDNPLRIWNTILWANSAGGYGPQVYNSPDGNYFQAYYSTIQDGHLGCYPQTLVSTEPINEDPRFLSPDLGYFNLRGNSPLIDKGSHSAPFLNLPDPPHPIVKSEDFDRGPRLEDGDEDGTAQVDIGALEFSVGDPTTVIWHIDGSSSVDGDGLTWQEPRNSIQKGVDSAIAGDEIWIKEGIYSLDEQITISKWVELYGGFNGTETARGERNPSVYPSVIQAAGDNRTVYISAGNPVLDGLIFTRDESDPGNGNGVQVYRTNPTFRNCTFTGHRNKSHALYLDQSDPSIESTVFSDNHTNDTTSSGGAIYAQEYSDITISNSTFANNSTTRSGGAIYNQNGSLSISSTLFEGNQAQTRKGGAIYAQDTAIAIDFGTFRKNTALTQSDGIGGAICYWVLQSSGHPDVTITNSTFEDNQAYSGGAVYLYNNYSYGGTGYTNPDLQVNILDTTFSWNSATFATGALYNGASSGAVERVIFANNIAAEHGGAVNNVGSGTYRNCYFINNKSTRYHGGALEGYLFDFSIINATFRNNRAEYYGGAIYVTNSMPSISNSIIYGNSSGHGGATDGYISGQSTFAPQITFSDDQDEYPGTGNINEDPGFLGPMVGYLRNDSPCIDQGLAPDTPGVDIEKLPRITGQGDMGAYEYQNGTGYDALIVDYGIVGPLEVPENQTRQYSYIGFRNDGSTTDLTNQARWFIKDGVGSFPAPGQFQAGAIPGAPANDQLDMTIGARHKFFESTKDIQIVLFVIKPGDIDGNGSVTIYDLIYALQIVAGKEPNAAIEQAGDVNSDGLIGTAEAIYIIDELGQ